ncbi:MAG: DUF1295 domain-containing protein [Gemmatimonadota bacterium]|nr:MAG: DUF1295 domain-containing protein [Gemmatimonadota bacterium]
MSIALTALGAILGLMTLVWIVSVIERDASIIDIFWGIGFVVAAWIYFYFTEAETMRRYLVAGLVTLWGVRLSVYIFWRNWGEGEDYRYRTMRAKNPKLFPWLSLATVFWLQAVLCWAISIPFLQAQRAPTPQSLIWLDWLAIIFFVIGFTFEAGGDLQLALFKRDPQNRGKVLDRGFWRYTRHPNYFGDAMVWWGFFLFAAATPGALWTIYSPILMTFLLLRVSGVALLERGLRETKPAYRDYVRRTSAFVPWFPRR